MSEESTAVTPPAASLRMLGDASVPVCVDDSCVIPTPAEPNAG